jgi:hypothetical protein
MILRCLLALFLVLPCTAAATPDDNPPWVKPEQARARSGLSGKPILYFVSTDLTPGATTLLGGLDRMFGARSLRPKWDDFIWVKVADLKTMDLVKANSVNELIICDPDQNELFRGVVKEAAEAEKGMDAALKKYAPRAILYKKYDAAVFKDAGAATKPLVVVFADESKESQTVLTSLEDRMVAQVTPKCEFVRFFFRKDSEDAKHWNILSAPTLIILDATREEGPKATIERTTGKKTPPEIKSLLLRALKAVEKRDTAEK